MARSANDINRNRWADVEEDYVPHKSNRHERKAARHAEKTRFKSMLNNSGGSIDDFIEDYKEYEKTLDNHS